MIKLKGDFMFDKTIIKILFNIHDNWNMTHIDYWLETRKIKFINITQERHYYIVNIRKITKDTQYNVSELKGEKGILFHYL
jgi:hypothetical protein